MLRVHLTAEDLLRTRFASRPAPLTELVMAFATLQRRDVLFDGWRRELGGRLPRVARSLFELVPPTAAGPEFLDPVSDGFDDGLDTVLSASTLLVQSELRRVCSAGQPITPWMRALDERDADAWQQLAAAVRAGHDTVLPGSWPRVQQSFCADVAWRSRLIAEQGLHAALAGLHPRARWNGSTLELDVDSHFVSRPAGRGMTLLPSAFWTGRPMIGTHPDGSVLVVYPSLTPLPLIDGPAGRGPARRPARPHPRRRLDPGRRRTHHRPARPRTRHQRGVNLQAHRHTAPRRAARQRAFRQDGHTHRDTAGRPATRPVRAAAALHVTVDRADVDDGHAEQPIAPIIHPPRHGPAAAAA